MKKKDVIIYEKEIRILIFIFKGIQKDLENLHSHLIDLYLNIEFLDRKKVKLKRLHRKLITRKLKDLEKIMTEQAYYLDELRDYYENIKELWKID